MLQLLQAPVQQQRLHHTSVHLNPDVHLTGHLVTFLRLPQVPIQRQCLFLSTRQLALAEAVFHLLGWPEDAVLLQECGGSTEGLWRTRHGGCCAAERVALHFQHVQLNMLHFTFSMWSSMCCTSHSACAAQRVALHFQHLELNVLHFILNMK